jgi:quercetin dioxygenase-like cupin family protein
MYTSPVCDGKRLTLFAAFCMTLLGASSMPEYSIEAIRFADSPGDSVPSLVMGAPQGEKIDTVYIVWLIRGGGRNILFDSGFHRARYFKEWAIKDYLRPDEAVRLAGVKPEEITDVVISHAHWDHLGGIDLFPKATVWLQKDEFRYYTKAAWQPGGDHNGIDPDDVQQLVRLNTEGRLQLVDGNDVEILPGIRAYTGGRHTFASQYLRVGGHPPSTILLKATPGCVVPWHYHTAMEQVVVIRGLLKMEMTGHSATTVGPGGFAAMPSKMAHRFVCSGKRECLLTVMFDGAYDIFWLKEK